jgi:hypothetical protein
MCSAVVRSLFALTLVIGLAGPAAAQRFAVEGGYGGARFTESEGFDHSAFTAGGGWQVTPRLRIGPEVVYLRGPASDRDLIVTGNATFDLSGHATTAYLVGGGGLFRHSDTFLSGRFTSTEGSFTAGIGVRIPVGPGWYLTPEARIGWETHVRAQVLLGRRW